MQLPLKTLLVLISFNFLNMQAMEHTKQLDGNIKRDDQVSSFCGEEINLEGGRGTYPEPTKEELELFRAQWDREHTVSWKEIFCCCFSSKK